MIDTTQGNNAGGNPAGGPPGKDDDLNDANFDDWNGYSGSLFAGLNEDAEDKDADT